MMTKKEAIKLIDDHKNALMNPVEMLHWTWLRVILNQIPEDCWDRYLGEAKKILSC